MVFLGLFLLLASRHFTISVASPWIVTEYYAEGVATLVEGYTGVRTTENPVLWTGTIPVTPTGTAPSALATSTSIEGIYDDVTVVDVFLAPSQGVPVSQLYSTEYYQYYVTIVYTAPASCSFTNSISTAAVYIPVPYEVEDALTPTKITASVVSYPWNNDLFTQTMAFLDPSDVPSSVLASASSEYMPYDFRYCLRPYTYTYPTPTATGSSFDGDDADTWAGCTRFRWYVGNHALSGGYCCDDGCYYTWGVTPWGFALAIFFPGSACS